MAARRPAPTLDRLSSINADGSRLHIRPSDAPGRFITARRVVFALLILFYVSLPFVKIDGRPAMQLDVMSRRFYLFGAVFNAQDFWRVVFLLLVLAIGLVLVTAVVGRVWCGWACPQTVFLEGLYRPLERFIEGPREKRIRLGMAPWGFEKIWKRTLLHAGYVLISLGISHVALALFVSLPSMWEMIRSSPAEHWEAFLWTTLTAGAFYFNFAWFREQLCIVVCPYGRMQSVLLDRDSLIIGYDKTRGEPRGKLRKRSVPLPVVEAPQTSASDIIRLPEEPAQGDCVDCNRCVTACPTGIDIRNGLQMECIACAQCIDACDDVMTRIGKPKGLIRYDSLNGLEGKGRKRLFRPRLVLYGAILVVVSSALIYFTLSRLPFEANVLRVRGLPFVVQNDVIRNQFELHLVSKNPAPSTLTVRVQAPVDIDLTMPAVDGKVSLGPTADFRLPIFASVKRSDWAGPFELSVTITDEATGDTKTTTAKFLGPPR